MVDALILMLPQARLLADQDSHDVMAIAMPYWAKISAGRVVASGSGNGWRDGENAAYGAEDGPKHEPLFIALAPAEDAPVRFVAYENLAPAQAAAAARIEAAKYLLGDAAESHIASGTPSEAGQAFPLCTTSHAAMQAWQKYLSAQGVDAARMIPVAAILPPPEGDGLHALDLGGDVIMRSAQQGYASDDAIDALIAGKAGVQFIGEEEWQIALAFAAQSPPVNLLSGAWTRKSGWQLDPLWLRWVKILAVLLIMLSLALPLVQALKYKADESRANRAVLAAAAELGISAADAAGVEAEMDRRLGQRADGPLAFTVPASALYSAMLDAPAVSLKNIAHRSDGTLTAMLAAPRSEDINPVLLALQARGYQITAQPMAGNDGQEMANVTIRAVP